MQFIARFELTPLPETVEICKSMNMEDLAPERIFEEWKKLILKGINLSDGLNFLKQYELGKIFPRTCCLDRMQPGP
jgi:tRNA nucleotidyltransferase (CCA-adding enzyme)